MTRARAVTLLLLSACGVHISTAWVSAPAGRASPILRGSARVYTPQGCVVAVASARDEDETALALPSAAVSQQQLRRRKQLAVAGSAALLCTTLAVLQPAAALAAAKAGAAAVSEEHLHLGQKVALYCRNTGG
jgi:hypothetical protein